MKKILVIIVGLLFVNNLIAGDKEDLIKQIKQQWVDFSNKKANMSTMNKNGAWQATSQGGLWEFQTPKEFKAQIEEGPNTFNFSTRHIEVTIVGKSKDVAYANYYLVGTITGTNGLIASNYRTRASGIYLKKNGNWVSYGQHFSPLMGGSGVTFQ
jgi:hypothetical protein|tara:strand:+ start:1155 stop:1619 length:465 start_codon:yes stop_codon:yes gene_type:complete